MRHRHPSLFLFVFVAALLCLLLAACTDRPDTPAETTESEAALTEPTTAPATAPLSPADTEPVTEPVTEPETYEIYEEVIGDIRVQLYSPSVLRIEEAEQSTFCDDATLAVTNRTDWPGVKVERRESNGKIHLITPTYTVVISAGADNVRKVTVKDPAGETIWTVRNAHANANVTLPAPAVTPAVWSFSDTPRLTIPDNGFTTVTDAPDNGFTYNPKTADHYIFICAGDPFALRADYNRLVGACDMVTVKALGLWFSRYYAYRDTELLALVDTYRERGYPIDYIVCDTDWKVGASTGYDINRHLFPDMEQFLADMHEKNISIAFNDHVRDYAGSLLEAEQINWFNENLTAKLNMGLDTWWYDRNWMYKLKSPFQNLNADMLGQLLYGSIAEAHDAPLNKRTVLLSNYYADVNGRLSLPAYVGTHRYSVQWSGDTSNIALPTELENMVKLGALTSTAYVSSDIGGHLGVPSDGMFIRWSQYGALSPIMRYHSSSADRSPWTHGETADEVARTYINLRYRLLPLYYTLAHENYADGLPLARRLDFYYPQYEQSRANDQYLLGEDILIAPIVTSQSGDSPLPASWLTTPDGEPGVLITYYNGTALQGKPLATQIAPTIGFHWGTGSPMAGVPAEQFSATMEATLTVGDFDIYLGTLSDDGVRVYVDDQLIIDFWQASDSMVQMNKSFVLKAGTTHKLRVEYYEAYGDAIIRVLHTPVDPSSVEAMTDKRSVFIPDGTWMDVFTGKTYTGPETITVRHTLKTSPIFVRLGSLSALAYKSDYADTDQWQRLVLDVYPAADTRDTSTLYEDDGQSLDYRSGASRKTTLSLATEGTTTTVTVGAAEGAYVTDWTEREWTLRIHAATVKSVTVNGEAVDFTVIPRDATAAPFATEGGSPDGDVTVVTFTAPITEATTVVIE